MEALRPDLVNAMSKTIDTQAERIAKLESDLKAQLMNFMAWYCGDENNELPDAEGIEKIIDIYVKQ